MESSGVLSAESTAESTKALHKTSMYNKDKLLASEEVGCFHCIRGIFPDEITEFADDGRTGLCPNCKVDALMSSDDMDIHTHNLIVMNEIWFNTVE